MALERQRMLLCLVLLVRVGIGWGVLSLSLWGAWPRRIQDPGSAFCALPFSASACLVGADGLSLGEAATSDVSCADGGRAIHVAERDDESSRRRTTISQQSCPCLVSFSCFLLTWLYLSVCLFRHVPKQLGALLPSLLDSVGNYLPSTRVAHVSARAVSVPLPYLF